MSERVMGGNLRFRPDMDADLESCFQFESSRSKREYNFLCKLGTGGYGSVSKVCNKLDKHEYALKRIRLNIQHKNFEKMRREVVYLSALNHSNVVRYFTAWIDLPESDILNSDTDTTEESDTGFYSTSSERSDLKDTSVKEKLMTNTSDSIVFAEPKDDDDNDDLVSSDFISSSVKEKLMAEIKSAEPNRKLGLKGSIFDLCITMECCDKTLRDYIDSGLQNDKITWKLFKDILEGLHYIHGIHLIHRDLKPENIFICGTEHLVAKIGDFGLAIMANPETQERHILSGQIGSLLYSAPEVNSQEGSTYNYDQRSDVFSLGLVFFEMSYRPIKTGSEKIKIFEALRNGAIPDDFEDKQKEDIILEMLKKNMQLRPFARDILKLVSSILSRNVGCDQEEDEQVMSDLQPSQSKADDHQFVDLENLVNNIGSKVLRRLFHFHTVTPQDTLSQHLNKYSDRISQMKDLFLTKGQMDSLFPNDKPPCLKGFGILPMCALLHHTVLTLNEVEKKQITELKVLRNELAHSPSSKISSDSFNERWEKARSILTNLSERFQDTDYEEEIQKDIQSVRIVR